MKIPLIGTLGLNTNTALFLGIAGVAAFTILHNYGINLGGLDKPSAPKHTVVYDPDNDGDDHSNLPYGPLDDHDSDDVQDDGILQRMGWTIPTQNDEDYSESTRKMRQGWPMAENIERSAYEVPHINVGGIPIYRTNNFLKIADDSYDAADDDMRGDGFSGAYSARSYDTSIVSGQGSPTGSTGTTPNNPTTPTTGCVQTQMCPTTSYWDNTVCACVPMSTGTIGTVGGTTSAAVTDLQNRILREIISRTSNVSTILSSIDTVKAAIATYGIKLQLAIQQQQAGVINDIQMSQYLSQIATDIGTQLQLPLNPVTDASSLPGYGTNYQGYGSYGGSVYPYNQYGTTSPYSTGNNGAVSPYYQQYGQNYQDYVNQLNSNYYQYYQPSYQYFPGQNYNYYQPYQYQYPNPYYPQGQYPTNYPSYNYNYGSTAGAYSYPGAYGYGYPTTTYGYPGYGYGYDYDDYNQGGGGGLLGGIGNMVNGILGGIGI